MSGAITFSRVERLTDYDGDVYLRTTDALLDGERLDIRIRVCGEDIPEIVWPDGTNDYLTSGDTIAAVRTEARQLIRDYLTRETATS